MKKALIPIVAAVLIAIGVMIGAAIASNAYSERNSYGENFSSNNKISVAVDLINNNYVDTINMEQIVEDLMPTVLKQLDPHSSYIPAKDLAAVNEDLEGSFSGIGVQFNIQEDTVYIVDVISGSPSEKAGVLPGDRIVSVEDSIFVGKGINNEKVFNRLRGKKGSKIKIGVVRRHTPEVLEFEIVRGDIPINTVDVAYMLTDNIGMITVNRFGAQTYSEFLTGIAELRQKGAKKLIVDLRGNSGGYLDAAINMINEFLAKGSLIVYVEGNKQMRQDSYANGSGSFQGMELAVLIDEFSGSASEIFAGAIQDNDRGVIIGRRSFGKGLVQRPFDLSDGSQIRLTIARYYTPAGRCIQKPYDMGRGDEYESDIMKRFEHGEFFEADSIHLADSLVFKTKNGRTVYGGGGIMPDIFVARDTSMFSPLYLKLINKAVPYKFALKYTDKNREQLKTFKSWKELYDYLKTQDLLGEMRRSKYAKGISFTDKDLKISKKEIDKLIAAYIVRNIHGDDGFYPIWFENDITVIKAVEVLNNGLNL